MASIPDTTSELDWPFSEKNAPSPILHVAKLRRFTTNTSLAVGVAPMGGNIMSSGRVKLRVANRAPLSGGLSCTPEATHTLLVGIGAWACTGALNAACAASASASALTGPRKFELEAGSCWMIPFRSGLSIAAVTINSAGLLYPNRVGRTSGSCTPVHWFLEIAGGTSATDWTPQGMRIEQGADASLAVASMPPSVAGLIGAGSENLSVGPPRGARVNARAALAVDHR